MSLHNQRSKTMTDTQIFLRHAAEVCGRIDAEAVERLVQELKALREIGWPHGRHHAFLR